MRPYIGTKNLWARPMNLGDYNAYRGWELPANEDPSKEGYLVEYEPDPASERNHKDHAGYISWSSKEVFEKAYRGIQGLTFGQAIEALKIGKHVTRAGWNGKGMWLTYVTEWTIHGNTHPVRPFIAMKTVDNQLVPWLASQSDVLVEDWEVVA